MALVLNGDGNLTGLTAGGLPDASITQADLAAGVASNGPAFSATQSAAQSITSSTTTKITFDTKEFDTNNCFNTSTNRFTPTVAGYYHVVGCVYPNTTTTFSMTVIGKNGSNYKAVQTTATNVGVETSCIVYCNGTTDFIELYGYFTGTSPQTYAASVYTFFQASMVRAA